MVYIIVYLAQYMFGNYTKNTEGARIFKQQYLNNITLYNSIEKHKIQ